MRSCVTVAPVPGWGIWGWGSGEITVMWLGSAGRGPAVQGPSITSREVYTDLQNIC